MLYNVASLLAAVGFGCDIRISNNTAVHPQLQGANAAAEEDEEATPVKRQTSENYIGQRRDAYLSAVRDKIIEPEVNSQEFLYTPASGYAHNTYHGHQTRYRPSVNFEIPIRFTESYDGYYTADSKTPSSDNRTTPSADSRTTPSYSGTSFSGGTPSPRKSSRSSLENSLALISLSPSQDKAFVEYQRQVSDSSSVFETPKTTPQRFNVKFEDSLEYSPVHGSPSHALSISVPQTLEESVDHCKSPTPSGIRPPPPRRQNSDHHLQHSTAERPVTLDIIPRPRPHPSILKKTSPQHFGMQGSPRSGSTSHSSPRTRITPTPSDSISGGGDDTSYVSARSACSATSPGSTPPHIEHQRTLMDIDMAGQREDRTMPLPTKPKLNMQRHPTIHELEQEFLP